MTPVAVDHHPTYSNSSYPPHALYTTTSGFHASQPTNSQTSHRGIRHLILMVVVLFLIVCVSSSIAWLSIHPRLPLITLNSFTISNFTGFKSHLMSNGDIQLTVGNPNKKVNLFLESFRVEVFYRKKKKVVLSQTSMEDLYLEKKSENVSTAKLVFKGRDEISGCGEVLGDSGWNLRNGSVFLNVKMFISAKFIDGDWFSRRKAISVFCKKLELVAASNGTGKLIHGGKQCLVDLSV